MIAGKNKFGFLYTTNIPNYETNDVPRNDLIEAVPLNDKDLKVPGYLGKFKRHLKENMISFKELNRTS